MFLSSTVYAGCTPYMLGSHAACTRLSLLRLARDDGDYLEARMSPDDQTKVSNLCVPPSRDGPLQTIPSRTPSNVCERLCLGQSRCSVCPAFSPLGYGSICAIGSASRSGGHPLRVLRSTLVSQLFEPSKPVSDGSRNSLRPNSHVKAYLESVALPSLLFRYGRAVAVHAPAW